MIRNNITEKTLIVVGGGTGGHLFPAIATGEELINKGYKVHLITDRRCQKYLTSDLTIQTHIIDIKTPSKGTLSKIYFIISLLNAVFKAIFLIVSIKPKAIIGFGGYPAFPPLIASVLLRIPIVIHEQNCFLGKVNRFFLRFAKKVALSYQETKTHDFIDKQKIVFTGNVVRGNIKNLVIKNDFNHQPFRIFIFGGSQSAKVFTDIIPDSIKLLLQAHPNIKLYITQQARKEDHQKITKIYSDLNIPHQLSEFFFDMAEQYQKHELIIARAGASTIGEITCAGIPAIFIPLASAAQNHQFYNAKAIEESGGGWCFEQNNISTAKLAAKIFMLITNRDLLQQASNNLIKRKSDGGKILANIVDKMLIEKQT